MDMLMLGDSITRKEHTRVEEQWLRRRGGAMPKFGRIELCARMKFSEGWPEVYATSHISVLVPELSEL